MKIVVGLSGGVDSSVAAYLLQKQGHEVIGLFMRNWNDASVTLEDECPWIEDSNDALLVAKKLGIPFQVIDMSELYKERIVDYMFAEYEKGRTPNPDVLCNREVKFDVFLETALSLGADKVATGHYAKLDSFTNENGEEVYQLLAGKDNNKDQSYFLCQLSQKQLSKNHPIYLFGGGKKEVEILSKWEQEIENVTSLAGKLSLKEELQKISELELMISMDSANMHLASLVGTRVVSVWGATHYFAGFLGYGQSENDIVEIKNLECRPCSVFGNKPCFRGDYACLNQIEISQILKKI